MTWRQRYKLKRFLQTSLWPAPLMAMVGAFFVGPCIRLVDEWTGWTLPVSAEGARAVAGNLSAALLTFIVFVFTILLVALQLASAQLTPRVILRMFMDPFTKVALSVFTFTYTISLGIIARLRDPVPLFSGVFFAYGSLACLAIFLFLIDRFGKELRPVRVLTSIATQGRKVIRSVYPLRLVTAGAGEKNEPRPLGEPDQVLEHRGAPGHVLAFDEQGLFKLASTAKCIIELVPQVGDFVATDDPLFRVHRNGQPIDENILIESIAFGPQRTLDQDPAFTFRIIVDIANKALSPAINDPTTAVLAIDQIHHLLRQVGMRQLDTGRVRDTEGRLRLLYRTPDWEDFVSLAVTEIRHFGGGSIQVVRRLRAMLENLIKTLPAQRGAILLQELDLIHRAVARAFCEPEDRAKADTGDLQGIGGTGEERRPSE
jgi:uncharacterized membrane protein